MNTATPASTAEPFEDTGENFAELFEASIAGSALTEGARIEARVVDLQGDFVILDAGLKSEGRVSRKEFTRGGELEELNIGDTVEVVLERLENRDGEAVLSREKALREEAWKRLEAAHEGNTHVDGIIFGRVKGGFTVDLDGAVAFLPGSQVDIRPVRDVSPLMGVPQPFQILKMDRRRGNIVVSRRAVLEESRAEIRNEILAQIHEGQVLEGVVKNITDYGAFIDLGGVDGLLHVTDISWRRINHPSEVLKLGETVQVQVTKFNDETKRISLGMKQLETNPWDGVQARFMVQSRLKGTITNVTDYGAFVELEPGIEGLVHVSEMSWSKKVPDPSKLVQLGDEVEVMVLDVDPSKQRISLGIKQCEDNPWSTFADNHAVGDVITGEIKNVADFGLFIGLEGGIDGLVHSNDLSWEQSSEEALKAYTKGESLEAKILSIDVDKERVSLGVKQLSEDPKAGVLSGMNKGSVVTCTISAVQKDGIEVTVGEDVQSFIKKADLARERQEQRPDRFAVGDRVDAKVLTVDHAKNKVSLSIKALEVEEHKRAIKEYGSTDSGASLGDILGAALSKGNLKVADSEGSTDQAEEETSDDTKPEEESENKA